MIYILLAAYLLVAVILSQNVFKTLVRYRPQDNTWKAAFFVVLVSLRWPYTLTQMIIKGGPDALHEDRKKEKEPDR